MSATFTEGDLGQFYGTENYYRHWTRQLVYTDGIHYLAEHGAAWLVDAVASYQTEPKLNKGDLADFQIWHLKVNADKSAVLTCKADSGRPAVVTQNIEYTDFPLGELKLYVELGGVGGKPVKVLMLPSER
jgi:hypothetical protein